MRVGFTGTQTGMTQQQAHLALELLQQLKKRANAQHRDAYFHHGLCVGADEQAHGIARSIDFLIIGHPPLNISKMMRITPSEFGALYPAKDYISRNHDIVHQAAAMLATPKGMEEELRSGTWATIRYARRLARPLAVIWPNGTTTFEHWEGPSS